MLHFITLPFFEAGSDAHELGLMAAASPEFAEAFARHLVELAGSASGQATSTREWVDAAPGRSQLSSR